ncbi:GNAT family N-acetyltransferase [Streptomyces flavofungini]|uniref:GNAT family N-acetyltransferase n=1 Tax=Streptomyces flavofungini TaxID=68200 RepID=A0ABS0XJJ9_9ACTN|nr:GNAT family N-acetyltransferase [Streptomyces flavofungini]MBJ3813111.1 GNAT family N-acetyltransferase [Streptomyces flavofungini]GHC89558.1 N-acetyltransferase [Streptomyces flavofungini]
MTDNDLLLQQFTAPHQVTPQLRQALVECWVEVTNSGGAAGFPFPPIDEKQAAPAVDRIVGSLAPQTSRLLTATVEGELVGWLNVRRDTFELIAHWGTLHHVQTRPARRGRGFGVALMSELRKIARDEMGLEQLHLAARGGVGLEEFYGRLGWKEVGRWPAALRLAPSDDRDEILMLLAPL